MRNSLFCILLLLSACRPGTEVTSPDPWEDVQAEPLDPFRLMMGVELRSSRQPHRLAVLERARLTFVLDPYGGQVHIVDERMGHSGLTHCVPASKWPTVEARDDHRGTCDEGLVEVHRGFVQTAGQPAALAVDEEGLAVWVVDSLSNLYRIEADLLGSHPWDYLRRDVGVELSEAVPPGLLHAAFFEGRIWLAGNRSLQSFETTGQLASQETLASDAVGLAVSGEHLWVATEASVATGALRHVPEGELGGVAGDGDGGVWVSLPEEDLLVHVGLAGEIEQVEVLDLEGRLSVDPRSQRVYAALDDGVVQVAEGVLVGEYRMGAVRDVLALPTHEIQVLDDEGGLRIYFDEESLETGGAPLDFYVTTFLEKPRGQGDDVECTTGEVSLEWLVQRALRNRTLLDDTPAPVALGLTPHFARRVVQCGMEEDVRHLWEDSETEVGVLFHQQPEESCAESAQCYAQFVRDQPGSFAALGVEPSWASGMSSHADSGADFVKGLLDSGLEGRYLFFGAGVLPGVSLVEDPRAKEAWPLETADLSRPFRASRNEEIGTGNTEGDVLFYPGDSRASFNLGGCTGLLVRECHALNMGGGQVLDDMDVAILDLMLHRAVAMRSDTGLSTWSFHLPDINSYDYTVRCEEAEREWAGESCQGGRLQRWLVDVEARFGTAGIVDWTLPSAQAEPG